MILTLFLDSSTAVTWHRLFFLFTKSAKSFTWIANFHSS